VADVALIAEPLDRIYHPKDLPLVTGLSVVTIWRLQRRGEFPPYIHLSKGRRGIRSSQVREWLDQRAARSTER
jgi:prophage regulatory protein